MPINSFEDDPMSWKPSIAKNEKLIYLKIMLQEMDYEK
jgi:hypothetical protein